MASGTLAMIDAGTPSVARILLYLVRPSLLNKPHAITDQVPNDTGTNDRKLRVLPALLSSSQTLPRSASGQVDKRIWSLLCVAEMLSFDYTAAPS